jgi:hypothetical protein
MASFYPRGRWEQPCGAGAQLLRCSAASRRPAAATSRPSLAFPRPLLPSLHPTLAAHRLGLTATRPRCPSWPPLFAHRQRYSPCPARSPFQPEAPWPPPTPPLCSMAGRPPTHPSPEPPAHHTPPLHTSHQTGWARAPHAMCHLQCGSADERTYRGGPAQRLGAASEAYGQRVLELDPPVPDLAHHHVPKLDPPMLDPPLLHRQKGSLPYRARRAAGAEAHQPPPVPPPRSPHHETSLQASFHHLPPQPVRPLVP